MFADYVYEQSAANYTNKILLVDADNLYEHTRFTDSFKAHGFEIVVYNDDLSFRIEYEEKIKCTENRIVVVARPEQYVPYDLRLKLTTFVVSLADLFPRLNTEVLRETDKENYDLISSAYKQTYDHYRSVSETERFLQTQAYSKENVKENLESRYKKLLYLSRDCTSYRDWFSIAETKAYINCMAGEYELSFDTTEIDICFRDYILKQYGKLSIQIDRESPVLVSKAMEFMNEYSKKFIVIVMDGMSEFDWYILSKSFRGINYHRTSVFAMIPTVTSISRQCLLSNKYPRELESPWNQSKEKKEFIACAKNMGFDDNQISYQRGYNADFGFLIRCGAVIINDIDDMVHGQKQGRIGMFNDVGIMAKQKKLATMTRRFLSKGFDVYITSDHGNTVRRGMGRLMSTGVETETKSRCILVLKDFANKDIIKDKYGLLEFPKIYLPKEYDYLICDLGNSFDTKNENVMSHGGISIDECVVPFIKIKAVENSG